MRNQQLQIFETGDCKLGLKRKNESAPCSKALSSILKCLFNYYLFSFTVPLDLVVLPKPVVPVAEPTVDVVLAPSVLSEEVPV